MTCASLRWLAVFALGFALPSAVHADGPKDAWLGTWTGKVRARGCRDGLRNVTLEVAVATDAVTRTDGDVFMDGLGDIDWRVTSRKLDGSREGLVVTMKRSKKAARLVLRTRGCRISGTLRRTREGTAAVPVSTTHQVTGVAACDELLRLRHELAACPKVHQVQRAAVQEATQSWLAEFHKMSRVGLQDRAAKHCKVAADGIRTAIADAGC